MDSTAFEKDHGIEKRCEKDLPRKTSHKEKDVFDGVCAR
jgi:hypothetical protein